MESIGNPHARCVLNGITLYMAEKKNAGANMARGTCAAVEGEARVPTLQCRCSRFLSLIAIPMVFATFTKYSYYLLRDLQLSILSRQQTFEIYLLFIRIG